MMEIRDLSVVYRTPAGDVQALRHVDLTACAGEVLGIMGESGCGKSTLAAATIGLLGANARVTSGTVSLQGQDVATMSPADQRALRGRRVAMVFQDPMTAFNPVLTIGAQLVDYQGSLQQPKAARRTNAAKMLEKVGIADATRCMDRYPHELSGGMRQRVAIAAALLMQPQVLIADEPTTALDVTMEAQILHLFRALQRDYHGAIVIVTHQLGVIAQLCDRVMVMYAGQLVEEGPVDAIFHAPQHPYTRALLACDPAVMAVTTDAFPTIGGQLPDLTNPPPGCAFAARCAQVMPGCAAPPPRVTITPDHHALCHAVRP
jgi:peptide/nickel transport system ATP-binding protein